jgi:putative addiction module component (TIGR02574 family)
MSEALLEAALQLSVRERLRVVEEVWESIREDPDTLPLTDAQRAELDRRTDSLDGRRPTVAW